jgi:hypothetical protein
MRCIVWIEIGHGTRHRRWQGNGVVDAVDGGGVLLCRDIVAPGQVGNLELFDEVALLEAEHVTLHDALHQDHAKEHSDKEPDHCHDDKKYRYDQHKDTSTVTAIATATRLTATSADVAVATVTAGRVAAAAAAVVSRGRYWSIK